MMLLCYLVEGVGYASVPGVAHDVWLNMGWTRTSSRRIRRQLRLSRSVLARVRAWGRRPMERRGGAAFSAARHGRNDVESTKNDLSVLAAGLRSKLVCCAPQARSGE